MNKKPVLLAILLIIVFGGGSMFCNFFNDKTFPSNVSENQTVLSEQAVSDDTINRKISSEDAKKRMDNEEHYILLDVRTDSEFNESHIEGAILIPDYEISDRAEMELPDKDVLILIYCRSGRRSANTVNELVNMGYTNVFDFGGIIDWPYETVR